MTLKEIKDLIKAVENSNLTEFKMEKQDFRISLRTDKKAVQSGQVMTASPAMIAAPPTSLAAPKAESKAPVAAAKNDSTDTDSNSSNLLEVKSPIVGTFYRSPSPDKDVFVKVGDTIEVGSVVCIVEAMKLFNEIESEVAGKIVKVLVDDSSPVEYDQVLFLVDPNG